MTSTTSLREFIIRIDMPDEGETDRVQFVILEEPERRLEIKRFDHLDDARAWIARPVCTWQEQHEGFPAPDDLPSDVYVEDCDREISARLVTYDSWQAGYDMLYSGAPREVAGRAVHLLCDGHAARLRELANEDLRIETDEEVSA